MDFGEILRQWEGRPRPAKRSSPMDEWLERYPPGRGEGAERRPDEPERPPTARHAALRRMEPQAQLDLHGLTSEEALRAVGRFLAECRSNGLEKVLIIHGKGHHSSGGPVLGSAVRRFLEHSPHAGPFGEAEARWGGRGALWVLLRQRSR